MIGDDADGVTRIKAARAVGAVDGGGPGSRTGSGSSDISGGGGSDAAGGDVPDD